MNDHADCELDYEFQADQLVALRAEVARLKEEREGLIVWASTQECENLWQAGRSDLNGMSGWPECLNCAGIGWLGDETDPTECPICCGIEYTCGRCEPCKARAKGEK